MAYYIEPPKGTFKLAKLESYGYKRLDFLINVYKCCGNVVAIRDLLETECTLENSDCLIEGTKKDSISHFLLRLASSQCPEMKQFFVEAELHLFRYRFSCMNKEELLGCVKPLKRFTKKLANVSFQDKNSPFGSVAVLLLAIDKQYSWETIIDDYLGRRRISLGVPFQCVPRLVANRQVHLKMGIAYVPSKLLSDLMCLIFKLFVKLGSHNCVKHLDSVFEDKRMKHIMRSLMYIYRRSPCINSQHQIDGRIKLWGPVLCDDIENLVDMFPPCMAYLHFELRRKHRLRHFSRIQYTLFLKELGLPLQEAVHFWRQEYSIPPKSDESACCHVWKKDERRYTYSVRHLYGLEGSRVNYKAHCCTSLQNENHASAEEGGCLFTRFDDKHLVDELLRQGCPHYQLESILALKRQQKYQVACQMFLSGKVNQEGVFTCASSTDMEDTASDIGCPKKAVPGVSSTKDLAGEARMNTESPSVHVSNSAQQTTQSCYDHNDCPPSQSVPIQLSQDENKPTTVNFNGHKPIDLYVTYQELINGLETASKLT